MKIYRIYTIDRTQDGYFFDGTEKIVAAENEEEAWEKAGDYSMSSTITELTDEELEKYIERFGLAFSKADEVLHSAYQAKREKRRGGPDIY